ncbi:hypothetical protein Tco_0575604 [Tanacetum coccineum]
MDTGASSHLNFNASNLSTIFDKRLFPSVHVGDGKSIPVTNTGYSIIHSHHRPLHHHNVLVTPNIIKNSISVRQFTRDNNCTIEFDAFDFSMKDYLTRHILLRCDSSGDLYQVTKSSTSPIAFLSTSASTWHQRLGHPSSQSVVPSGRLTRLEDSLVCEARSCMSPTPSKRFTSIIDESATLNESHGRENPPPQLLRNRDLVSHQV